MKARMMKEVIRDTLVSRESMRTDSMRLDSMGRDSLRSDSMPTRARGASVASVGDHRLSERLSMMDQDDIV